VFRALLSRAPSDSLLASTWRREGEVAGWLSRSTWALALIAQWRCRLAPKSSISVWVPDFFCNSALTALRATGVKLVFYTLTDKLAPDIAACKFKLASESMDLFILVHYFGQPIPSAPARDLCAQHGAWLIEDAVHALRPGGGIGDFGDFVTYSPHKHLPIPNGAVLIARTKGPSRFTVEEIASFDLPNSWPRQLRELQEDLGCSDNRSRARAAIWLIKRMLQKVGVGFGGRFQQAYSESPSGPGAPLKILDAPVINGLSRRLLQPLLRDLAAIARLRRNHASLWDALLAGDTPPVAAPMTPAARSEDGCVSPYLAAYRVEPGIAEESYMRLAGEGLPVSTWPDLPPEVSCQREKHARAWSLRHTRIYLPVHQSLDEIEMIRQRPTAERSIAGGIRVELVWDVPGPLDWQNWETQAGRSNLMQTWAYGEAKSICEGWRVRRGIIRVNDERVAVVQLLQKRIAGTFTVTRINRGPLYLRTLLRAEQRAVWEKLSGLGKIWRGRILAVAPELCASGSSFVLLAELGFRKSPATSWESAWIDLGVEPDVLRKRLDGKWRNMLAFAEKCGLQLKIESDEESYQWMLDRYKNLMLCKKFAGPAVGLLRALRDRLEDKSKLLIFRALHDGEPVAGVCLIRHGAAATYLLGWNGEKGRRLKANHYLLWSAIMQLKKFGVSWFDLGGISEENAAGVAAFKLGLNGERYELAGEYWKS
jgi:hypothetical protein